MAKVKLKDGSVVDIEIDPAWGKDEVQRAIREYKEIKANPDPSETDDWGTYMDKQVKSTARGGVGGLASTVDLAKNFILDAPANAVDWARGDPTRRDLWDSPVRDAYEANVIAQPRGSDYETNAAISEVAVPAVVETLATGSPKSLLAKTAGKGVLAGSKELLKGGARLASDAGAGYVGAEGLGMVGDTFLGPAGGDLGRLLGSAVAPAVRTRGGARALSTVPTAYMTGLPIPINAAKSLGLGKLDPTRLLPPATVADVMRAGRRGIFAGAGTQYEEER